MERENFGLVSRGWGEATQFSCIQQDAKSG